MKERDSSLVIYILRSIKDIFTRIAKGIARYSSETYSPLFSKKARNIQFDDKEVKESYPIGLLIGIIVVIIVILFSIYIRMNIGMFFRNINQVFLFFGRLVHPNFSYLSEVWGPLLDTIKLSLVGTLIGSVLAVPFAILSAANIVKLPFIFYPIRILMALIRTIPILVYALVFLLIFNAGIFTGSFAVTIFTFAIVAKMLYERIETIDMKSFEAIESTGATKFQCFMTAIVPDIIAGFLSILLYTFEINIRSAAILGYVGAGGIGYLLNERMSWRNYEDVGAVLLVFFVVVFIIENTSRVIRRRLQ